MPQIETGYGYEDEDHKTSLREGLGLSAFVSLSLLGDGYDFLATHPIPVGVRNLVSVVIGGGGTIGLDMRSLISDLQSNIRETFEDLTSTQ